MELQKLDQKTVLSLANKTFAREMNLRLEGHEKVLNAWKISLSEIRSNFTEAFDKSYVLH